MSLLIKNSGITLASLISARHLTLDMSCLCYVVDMDFRLALIVYSNVDVSAPLISLLVLCIQMHSNAYIRLSRCRSSSISMTATHKYGHRGLAYLIHGLR